MLIINNILITKIVLLILLLKILFGTIPNFFFEIKLCIIEYLKSVNLKQKPNPQILES